MYRTVAHVLQLNERTARRYLDHFVRIDLLRKCAYGVYEKAPDTAIDHCLPILGDSVLSDHGVFNASCSDDARMDDYPRDG